MRPSAPTDVAETKLIIQAIHCDLTEALRSTIRDKFAVLLRHNEHIVRLHVRLQQDQTMGSKHHYTATGQIEIGGPDLVASAEGKAAYDVLDALVAKLDQLLRRRHERRKDNRNNPHATELGVAFPKVSARGDEDGV